MICVLVNDYFGVNGGYIVIGVEENCKLNVVDDDWEVIFLFVGVKVSDIEWF